MYEASATFAETGGLPSAWKTLCDEVGTTLAALLSPGKVIAEVETMHALLAQAQQLQSIDPARAALLRRQATLTGLR